MKLPVATKVRKRTVCSERIKSWPAKERPRERDAADRLARDIDTEVEALILGAKS